MDIHPDNTLSKFTNNLSCPINLEGKWKVGIQEIFYPTTYEINTKTVKFSLFYGGTYRLGKFEFTYFESDDINKILKCINDVFKSSVSVINADYPPDSSTKWFYRDKSSKSELQIFSIPPTQTVIESSYEVEYRPNSSLDSSKCYEIVVPSSEDFTDMAASMLSLTIRVQTQNGSNIPETSKIMPVTNFGNSLFEQIDLFIGSVNTIQANNMYHYQSYIEDLLFRQHNPCDAGGETHETVLKMKFRQFPLIKYDSVDKDTYQIKFERLALHIKRVKLFAEASKSIILALEKGPAKYFITRNDTRNFSIPAGQMIASIDNMYSGILPRRIFMGITKETAHSGDLNEDPFSFNDFGLNYIALNVDGMTIPSIPYT
ncbi:uncharacterized protein LOC128388915 [Panonychus citri]|uniref:uncharacterized protein LOC128388915 n=1 Tax=Panonychus citri TaxID=50023 RepID=UPI0023077CAC|nr:uncharacterized protein LOC128388915 [Panonychus citri]